MNPSYNDDSRRPIRQSYSSTNRIHLRDCMHDIYYKERRLCNVRYHHLLCADALFLGIETKLY